VPGPSDSLEALLRRAPAGLPRVNRLTDLYNAVSVLHQIPLGGEDLTRYAGAPRLVRATGTQLREDTTAALFILDALDPVTDEALHAAADDLVTRLTQLGPDVRTARRVIAGP
jgi:DNA/RNA-binding domain of Phe-tRNA-synthetase-like protein